MSNWAKKFWLNVFYKYPDVNCKDIKTCLIDRQNDITEIREKQKLSKKDINTLYLILKAYFLLGDYKGIINETNNKINLDNLSQLLLHWYNIIRDVYSSNRIKEKYVNTFVKNFFREDTEYISNRLMQYLDTGDLRYYSEFEDRLVNKYTNKKTLNKLIDKSFDGLLYKTIIENKVYICDFLKQEIEVAHVYVYKYPDMKCTDVQTCLLNRQNEIEEICEKSKLSKNDINSLFLTLKAYFLLGNYNEINETNNKINLIDFGSALSEWYDIIKHKYLPTEIEEKYINMFVENFFRKDTYNFKIAIKPLMLFLMAKSYSHALYNNFEEKLKDKYTNENFLTKLYNKSFDDLLYKTIKENKEEVCLYLNLKIKDLVED